VLALLKGRAESRLRVADWRVIVELDTAARTIVIQRVLPRGRAYDRRQGICRRHRGADGGKGASRSRPCRPEWRQTLGVGFRADGGVTLPRRPKPGFPYETSRDPPPRGTTGTSCSSHHTTTEATCPASAGSATASARPLRLRLSVACRYSRGPRKHRLLAEQPSQLAPDGRAGRGHVRTLRRESGSGGAPIDDGVTLLPAARWARHGTPAHSLDRAAVSLSRQRSPYCSTA